MAFVVIFLISLFASVKVTTQGYVAKENVRNSFDAIIMNNMVFGIASLVFSLSLGKQIEPMVILYAVASGLCVAPFQIFYALALEKGPFSATCMIVNLSMLIPIIFSLVFYGEELTILKVLGVILCFIAMFLNTKTDNTKKVSGIWIVYVILAFLSTGMVGVVQKAFAKSQYGSNLEQFVFFGYATAFLFTFVLILINKKKGAERNLKFTRKNVFLISFIAVLLGCYQYFSTYGNSFVDAVVLSPSTSGLTTIMQMLAGKIIFKEKFTPKQIMAICVGISAILITSIG